MKKMQEESNKRFKWKAGNQLFLETAERNKDISLCIERLLNGDVTNNKTMIRLTTLIFFFKYKKLT